MLLHSPFLIHSLTLYGHRHGKLIEHHIESFFLVDIRLVAIIHEKLFKSIVGVFCKLRYIILELVLIM
jgi:hypothetical protein